MKSLHGSLITSSSINYIIIKKYALTIFGMKQGIFHKNWMFLE